MRRAISRRRSLNGKLASTASAATVASREPFQLDLEVVHARDLNAADLLTSDPYARVFIDNEFVGQTNIVSRTTSPVWNYRFKIPLLHPYVVMRIELTDYDDLSQDDPLGYVELRICELQEGVEQSHTLQVQNGAGTLHITTKLKMQKLVRLLVSPKTAVDPATLAAGALEVIDAYGTPHVCLDYIVETPYVSSHVHIPLVNDLLYDLNCILLAPRVETALLSPAYLTYPSTNRFTHRVIEVSSEDDGSPLTARMSRSASESPHRRRRFLARLRERIFKSNNSPNAQATLQQAFKLGEAIVASDLGPLGAVVGRALHAGTASTSLSATGEFKFPFSFIFRTDMGDWEFVAPDEATYWRWVLALTKALNFDAPPDYTFRSILRKRRRQGVASSGAYEYHDRWCEIDMHSRLFRYGDAETRMTKHFPLDSIRQINLSRDHHDPKQFLFSCTLARAFVPPVLAHKKKGTLTVSFHLVGETFRTTTPTTSTEAWDFGFDSALSLEEVQNKKLSVSLSLKSGMEHTRLGEARVPLSRLLAPDPYSANKEQSHIIPLSISRAQLKVTVRRGEELLAADSNGLSDPYCVVAGLLKDGSVGEKYKTGVCKATLNPVWQDDAFFFGSSRWTADDYSHIRITVFDKDRFSADDILGVVYIPVTDFPTTEETRMFPVQRHEDMTNVQLSTSLGQIEVSLQSVTVDSEIVADAPVIALQVVTKAEYCDEFSATWPANTLDNPQTTLQVAVGHDCLSILEPQLDAIATSSIRSCCHRLNSDVMRLDVWENERLVDGTWRASEPSTKHPYDPHFLSDGAASSHFLGETLAHLEPLDGYGWSGNWESAQKVEGCDENGWIYGDDFVRMTIDRTVSDNPTVRRRLWQRVMRRHHFVRGSRSRGDSGASAVSAPVTGSQRHRRLSSGFRRKRSSTGSFLHLHPDYDPLTRKASVSWDNVEYVRVLTPSTLYVQLRSVAIGPVEQAPLEVVVGPCPAHRLAALMLERKSLLGFRARLEDLMSTQQGSDDLEPVLSLLTDFAAVIPTCEQLVEDLVKQPGTQQEAEIVQQRVVRMRLYQSLLLTRQHRSDISTDNFANYIDKQIFQSLQQDLVLPSSLASEHKPLHTVQASIFRMRQTLALYERLVAECFLCGGANREAVIRRIECTVNKILPLVLSTLAQHMGTHSTLQQLSGQESKMKLVEFFILEDDAILRPLRTLISQFGFAIEPSAALSGYLDFDALLGSYTYLLEEEMKVWIKQTVRVAATTVDTSGSAIELPWTVTEQPNGQYRSTIPEDVAFALQTYIDDMAQDLSVGTLNTTAKVRFTAFQEKILTAVAGGLAWLAREYYGASLSSLSLDHQLSDDDFRKVVGFLTACINDGSRILDVYVLSLEAEGMNSMELDELDAEYSDMMLHAAECIAQLLLANNAELLNAQAWLTRWDAPDTVSALHQITLDLDTDLKHLRPMMPVVWVDKVTSLCVERMVVLFLQFIHELSGNGRPPLTEDEVARLEDDVQLVVDTFSSGPASRKAAHLQDFYTLLCSPIRNGNMRGDVFWETFGRLWARSNRHVCLSQYLAMCLRLRANKPVEEDPVWFVADAKNFDSDEMLAGFDGELLFRVIDGDQGARMPVEKESKARMELLVTVHQALDLLNVESIGKSDPYCRLKFADQEHRTRVIKNSLDPVWDETFRFAVPTIIGQGLTCELWDYNRIMPHQPLGHFVVSLAGLEVSDREQWYDVKNGTGRVLLSMHLNRPNA